ncbi:MAG: GNAT family N-acetyltransferase, partial [Pseudophaeobacter sp.]
EAEARQLQKTLLVLDTRSGDPSQRLYESIGYQVAGSIPGYCRNPHTEAYEPTTYLYKAIA